MQNNLTGRSQKKVYSHPRSGNVLHNHIGDNNVSICCLRVLLEGRAKL